MEETYQQKPDASEVVLRNDDRIACEAYIFEPSKQEAKLGYLFAVGETWSNEGVGKDLLDLVIQAMQSEYYRDPGRGVLPSFESALHQANLVLHDTAAQGMKDWMGNFNVAIGVMANTDLHISTAGNATINLVRQSQITPLAKDLSHSPVTNALKTFAQVASGEIMARDTLFFGTANMATLFRGEDLARFAIDHSSSTITTRLQQLYADQGSRDSLAALVVSMLPQHLTQLAPEMNVEAKNVSGLSKRSPDLSKTIAPKKPLDINRSVLKSMLTLLGRMIAVVSSWIYLKGMPVVFRGSKSGGKAIVSTSKSVRSATAKGWHKWQARKGGVASVEQPVDTPTQSKTTRIKIPSARNIVAIPVIIVIRLRDWLVRLPRTSKIFAVIAVILAIVLAVSVMLLQYRRAEETQIERASEILHDARTKQAAAETALIYDNRDQARNLISDAENSIEQLLATELYSEEISDLQKKIEIISDRLQKIVRASTTQTTVLGDFADLLGEANPQAIDYVNGKIFTFDQASNKIVSMQDDGTARVVNETTEGIGFFKVSAPHEADKSIIYITDAPGIAIFDTKEDTVAAQEIAWATSDPQPVSAATYGSRLYVYDSAGSNIYSYNKTLRGYTGGTIWIADEDYDGSNIVSIGIDGSIFALHQDGRISQLFKNEQIEFEAEKVEPSLAGAEKIIATETFTNLYVLDKSNNRVVIFDKDGALIRQVFLDVAQQLVDVAIDENEETMLVLDGTRILTVDLTAGEAE